MINQYPSAYLTVWVPHTVPARYQRIKVLGHQQAPTGWLHSTYYADTLNCFEVCIVLYYVDVLLGAHIVTLHVQTYCRVCTVYSYNATNIHNELPMYHIHIATLFKFIFTQHTLKPQNSSTKGIFNLQTFRIWNWFVLMLIYLSN